MGHALPVYLINLDRRPDRLDFMRGQFDAAGIAFTRIAAADGRDPMVLDRSRRSRFCQLNPGEVGCFESHIRAWETLLASDAPAAIVMEDDVVIADDFLAVAEGAARQLAFDVVKLDYFASPLRVEDKAQAVTGPRTAFRYLGGDWCAGAYVLSRSGAALLLRRADNYFLPVDHYMYDQSSRIVYAGRIFSIVPAVAAQTASSAVPLPAFASNINAPHGPRRIAWKKRADRILSGIRGRTGPVNRIVCARLLARITREYGMRHVETTFLSAPPSAAPGAGASARAAP